MRALKGLSLPPPQQFLLTKGLPQRGCWDKQGGADLGLYRKSLATVFPEFKKWVPFFFWPTPFPQQGRIQTWQSTASLDPHLSETYTHTHRI